MQGNKLFRQEALERLSSPERLDQMLKVVDPRSWLPLATMGSLVAVAAVWSVFGRLPLTVTGQGVLIEPRRVVQFQAPSTGQVVSLAVQPGDQIEKGEVLGTVSQPNLEQQLRQENDKLAELIRQNQNTSEVQKRRIRLERENLELQQANLAESLRRAEIEKQLRDESLELLAQNRANLIKTLENFEHLNPELRDETLSSIEQNRASLSERLEQIKKLLPSLEDRLQKRRELSEQGLISKDTLLTAEQDYANSLAQISQLESELKSLDLEATNARAQYLQNVNQIDDLKAQLRQIDVEESNVKRQYLQSLTQIDELQTQIDRINSQKARLAQEEIETNFNRINQINEVKQRIAQLEQELENTSKIISNYDGRVLEVAVVPGQRLAEGARLGSIETEGSESELVSLAYFADRDGKKIKPGMQVQITPSIVKRERYGGIVGEVSQVSPFPVTVQDMSAIIGNQHLAESMAQSLAQGGGQAPIQVFAELESGDTISGYEWSSSDGPPLQLSSGTTTQVQVKVGEVAPIAYIIPLFRSLTGVY